MKYEFLQPFAIHEMGQRENQEDTIFPNAGQATADDRLFILCDGMGGHQSGEVASQIVCRELCRFITDHAQPGVPFTDDNLREAMHKMYDALDARDDNTSERKMGTTLVLLYFHAGGLTAAHLGDSRYYHIRPQTNEIVYRSFDHSSLNYRFETGEISFEEMKTMKGKNVILRAILPNQEEREMPDIVHIKDIKPDDWFFMCSDGMLETMSDEELLNTFCNKTLSDEQKYNWFLTSTESNQDNHSAYFIHISGVMNELVDADQPDDEQLARSRNRAFLAEMGYSAETDSPVVDDGAETVDADGAVTIEVTQEDTDTNIVPPVMGKPASSPTPAKRKNIWMWILGAILAIAVIAAIWMIFAPSSSPKKENPKSNNGTRIEYINDRNNRYQGDESRTEDNSENIQRGKNSAEELEDIVKEEAKKTDAQKKKTEKIKKAGKTTTEGTQIQNADQRVSVGSEGPTESNNEQGNSESQKVDAFDKLRKSSGIKKQMNEKGPENNGGGNNGNGSNSNDNQKSTGGTI
jgi:protein phosphatase